METRNCQNCKKDFPIESEDFDFYAKIKVPAPTFCPACRLQRRLVWMKGLQLFKRKCDLCGEMKFSMYHPDAPYIVYCDRCWWSDAWDSRDFGRDYDPSRPFLEQWKELLQTTPLLGLSVDKETGESSPYTNHVGKSKNCYLLFYAEHNEDSMYGYYLKDCKNVVDCTPVMNSEACYDSGNIFKCANVFGSYNVRWDIDSYFLHDSDKCTNCFGSASLRNKSYVFFNEQMTKEAYYAKLAEIDLGSYTSYTEWKNKAKEHWKKFPPKPTYDDFSSDCSGSYCFESRNCRECYEVQGAEDSKFLMLIKNGKVRDSYDYTDWGYNAESLYECMTVGEGVQNVKFSHESGFSLFDVEYSKLSIGSAHHFGCVSMRKTEYCILNKQYTKEEFESLRAKIIQDMNEYPYVSPVGHIYKYGEFFPPEFSPHFYNDTFASRFFPLSKEKVLLSGLQWYELEKKEYAITVPASDLPDNIKETSESILKEIIGCSECQRGFRIVPQELQFLRRYNLPLPRQCPFCRIWHKVDRWVSNMQLHVRTCDKCDKEFTTHYSKEQAPLVYCKTCYQQEVS
jgi:hypothetical protein